MNADLTILSLGGGTQSCALALMSAAGDLPKLDHVIFADTQGELPETYEYLDYLQPIVERAGIGWHVVSAGNLERAITGVELAAGANPTPPLTLKHPNGEKGRINGYKCSYDFKRSRIERQVKKLCGKPGAWKSAAIEQWIGFSLDEVRRMRDHPWMTNRWPLIELGMRRDDTIRWFSDNGHPTPPRSACWFCPNSGNERWSALKRDHPDLFDRAAQMDDAVRSARSFGTGTKGAFADGVELFFHGSAVPLRDADIRTARQRIAAAGQGELFDVDVLAADCTAGVCFT